MKEALLMHRQGDVLLVKIADLPAELVERQSDVLVEGEATGHVYRLSEGQIWQTREGLLYLRAAVGSKIIHEEHAALSLEPGYWQVIRQREYSPEMIRWVEDWCYPVPRSCKDSDISPRSKQPMPASSRASGSPLCFQRRLSTNGRRKHTCAKPIELTSGSLPQQSTGLIPHSPLFWPG